MREEGSEREGEEEESEILWREGERREVRGERREGRE